MSQFWITTRLYLFETMCNAPALKLEKRQFESCTFELIDRIAEVLLVSFPTKSQPIKFIEVYGKLTTAENFCFRRFGIDLMLSTHSRTMTPPELTQKIVSMSREMSNSDRLFTQAFGL